MNEKTLYTIFCRDAQMDLWYVWYRTMDLSEAIKAAKAAGGVVEATPVTDYREKK